MVRRPPDAREPVRFVPRATLTILLGVVLFLAVALLYSLPVLLEEPPPGAIPDWTRERVTAHLRGWRLLWLLIGSMALSAALVGRGWLPGMRR